MQKWERNLRVFPKRMEKFDDSEIEYIKAAAQAKNKNSSVTYNYNKDGH